MSFDSSSSSAHSRHTQCLHDFEGCTWHESLHYCYKTGTSEVACRKLTNEIACESKGCVFDEIAHVCLNKGESVACSFWIAQSDCEGTPGCAWTQGQACTQATTETVICNDVRSRAFCSSLGHCGM